MKGKGYGETLKQVGLFMPIPIGMYTLAPPMSERMIPAHRQLVFGGIFARLEKLNRLYREATRLNCVTDNRSFWILATLMAELKAFREPEGWHMHMNTSQILTCFPILSLHR